LETEGDASEKAPSEKIGEHHNSVKP
jgi:hypothetical protein